MSKNTIFQICLALFLICNEKLRPVGILWMLVALTVMFSELGLDILAFILACLFLVLFVGGAVSFACNKKSNIYFVNTTRKKKK